MDSIYMLCRERAKKKLDHRRTKDFVTQVFVQFAVDATMISILYGFCRLSYVCLLCFNGITVIIIGNEDAHPPNIQFVYVYTYKYDDDYLNTKKERQKKNEIKTQTKNKIHWKMVSFIGVNVCEWDKQSK